MLDDGGERNQLEEHHEVELGEERRLARLDPAHSSSSLELGPRNRDAASVFFVDGNIPSSRGARARWSAEPESLRLWGCRSRNSLFPFLGVEPSPFAGKRRSMDCWYWRVESVGERSDEGLSTTGSRGSVAWEQY